MITIYPAYFYILIIYIIIMIILIDKPIAWTSHDAITYIKGKLKLKKIWHSGTLDPAAQGLLLCASDGDTKRISDYVWLDKTYIAVIDLSARSDTRDKDAWKDLVQYDYDNEGIYKDGQKILWPSIDDIRDYLNNLIGIASLPVPPFSAKKISGKKWYELAREGKQDIKYTDMTIKSYSIISYSPPFVTVEIEVGSGTYIRSIAYDMWSKFATGWVLESLKRTKIGDFEIKLISKVEDSKINYVIKDM